MRREFIGILSAGALALIVALMGSAFGAHLAPGDSLAVFRGEFAVILIALAVLLWLLGAARRAALSAAVAAIALASLAPHWFTITATAAPDGEVTVYQKNLSFGLSDLSGIEADLQGTAPDIITLQELTVQNSGLLDALPAAYVTKLWCPISDVAIATVYPALPGSGHCLESNSYATVTVQGPDGPLRIISVHLQWPWPDRQMPQVRALIPALESQDDPTIIGGDFNMVRWSYAMRRIEAAANVAPVGQPTATFPFDWLLFGGLPIDHVLAPGPGRIETRPLLGSDHYGLLARVQL